jgi:flagellar hook-length control protein FliK
MKNLSLPMTPATALKATPNKGVSNNGKSVGTEQSPFKKMLTNQLQNQAQAQQLQGKKLVNKQLQERQLQDRQISDEQLQTRQDLVKLNVTTPEAAPSAQKIEGSSSELSPSKLDVSSANEKLATDSISAAGAKPEQSALVAASALKVELPLKDAVALKAATPVINAAESNAENLIAAFNIAVVNPQAQTKIFEAAGARQKNIANVITDTLAQNKAGADADKIVAQDVFESKSTVQKASWLDGLQPTTLRQAFADTVLQNKGQQNGLQQNVALQLNVAQNSAQPSSVQPNLAQQAGAIAATMPSALAATAATGPALVQAGSSNAMNTSPGKSGWDQAISQKMMWMVGGGVQSATLTLNPPDLGPLQVVINVNNDMVEANFMSDNADVRQALQDGLSNLRDKMNEAGIQLGQTNVSAGGQTQQEFQQAQQGRRTERMSGNISTAENPSLDRPVGVRMANGLVDTFA